MNALKIEFTSSIENINLVENFINKAKEEYNISDISYGNIMVAVTESVNNSILHGNHEDLNKKVFLTLELQNNKLKATVEDQGKGFDYENLPDPTAPENINKIGGRGVFLIKNLTDNVQYFDGGKKVEMYFSLS